MNIFSNLGITEILIILVLALLVVGPERLPELAQKLGTTLRDVRKAYDNLTADLGPELMSLQDTTKELRESVDSVRSIPQHMVKTVVEAAELDETIGELKAVSDDVGQVGQTLSAASDAIKNPVDAAASAARQALSPLEPTEVASQEDAVTEEAQPAEYEEEDGLSD
ncbi:twin-arginine translocase TatA/TatE family subunit [Chloroflexota bacterium]